MPATRKLSLAKMVCIVFMFCAAMAIASSAQTFSTLYNFSGGTDGRDPEAGLVKAPDGNFYGTTFIGSTVFKITPSGALTTLYQFCTLPGCPDGQGPTGLMLASDGNLYGATQIGGSQGWGTLFKITFSGTLTTLYNFCSQANCTDGSEPAPNLELIQGADGNFYGTTQMGGTGSGPDCPHGCGTVFKVTPSGTLTTLHRFGISDGYQPFSGLVQASDGNFYGTMGYGGTSGNGTVYKITPSGTFTTLYNFCLQACSDGANPSSALVQASDGNLYGVTYAGGSHYSVGTIFKITLGGTLTTVYNFCSLASCADGAQPIGALVQATDGNLYGTTWAGGTGGSEGTVFKVTLDGTLTTLHSFDTTDGANPIGELVQGNDGNFYGTTVNWGTYEDGTVFSLSGPPVSALQFVPLGQPCRAVDTRPPSGGGPIHGGTFQNFPISSEGACAAMPSAAAYSMNITVVPASRYLGYLTVWPAGGPRPTVSTLNSLDGRIKANAVIVPAGVGGAISVFVTDSANVILDVNGYFAPPTSSTLAFYPLPPCRVADTRDPNKPTGLGPPHLSQLVERDFPVLESSCLPTGIFPAAYSFNFTAVPYPKLGYPLGYLEVWPKDQKPQNPVSTLNNLMGTIVANAAIVPAGSSGEIAAFASNDTDLIIDINGYFAPEGTGGLSLYPVTPCRVLDTRNNHGQPFVGNLTPPVDVLNSGCGISSSAQAYVFNATAVPPGSLGFLTLWPDGSNRPGVSTLNALDGTITNNMAIVPAGTQGKVDAYANQLTQLILDISSYFAP